MDELHQIVAVSSHEKRIVLAIDSFKGCLTSVEANTAAAEGVLSCCPRAEIIQIPVSDGGEGWLEAYRSAIGGEVVELYVRDPLMRSVLSSYLITGDTAVIEMAKASGLPLLLPEERNVLRATSYGTGQLVVDAVRRGCRKIIVGLGGSATSDCGIGMIRAMIDAFAKQGTWDDIHELANIHFVIATDVTNPLCGPNGAACVFGPQKGATPEMVRLLDARASRFAEVSARHFGYDRQHLPGAGAAGGLGYAFLQYMNADCRSGIDLLLDSLRFDELLEHTTLVITGEGAADRQTLMGKLPFGILRRCKAYGIPVSLIAGQVSDDKELLEAGYACVDCINPPNTALSEAVNPVTAKKNISATVTAVLSDRFRGLSV